MTVYVDVISGETTARTSETQMFAGNTTTAGKYSPLYNGKLVKLQIMATPQAATSLCQAGYIKLSNPNWKPNSIILPFTGFGLATAPQAIGGNDLITEFVVDLAVATDSPLDTLLFEYDSPVTPRIRLVGTFTTG